jgi:hypothetical protein
MSNDLPHPSVTSRYYEVQYTALANWMAAEQAKHTGSVWIVEHSDIHGNPAPSLTDKIGALLARNAQLEESVTTP